MYLRETKQKRVGGQVITHLQLAESTWKPDRKRSETKIIYNCGRIDEPEVAENLRVKEVVVGDGERRRRYVVCHNRQEEKRQRNHREQVLKELEAELSTLRECSEEGHSKRVCNLRASGRYGKYIQLTQSGKAVIDQAKVREQEHLDGKFVVHSNDDTLNAEDMALSYKQLQ